MGISNVDVGNRVYFEGEYGTVLYIGSIDGVEGNWLGVEWDNVSRGKHSGCYNDKIYFETKVPNAGSFIRISKADLGISCLEAVRLKYGHENSSGAPNYINLPQKSGQMRHVELIGMKKIMGKQSNFSRLTDIVLSGLLVNGPGEENALKEMIPNIKDLDLSQTLLSSWKPVNDIVRQLSQLKTLALSKNRLKIPFNPEYLECYKSLKTMVLNEMCYCWTEILTCAIMWPDVEELSVQDNNISILEQPPCPIFSKLQILSLDNNCLQTWQEICKLGNLTSLRELHIDNVGLESIEFFGTSPLAKTELFQSLDTLFLKKNKLKKWQDISELNKLKSLRHLMIANNPVIALENPETARQLIIAKIQGLETLNRTQIDRSERRGAEIDYIKKFYKDWLKDESCKKDVLDNPNSLFLASHSSYPFLLKKYGAPEKNEIESKSTLIKDSLIAVKFYSPMTPDKPLLTKKLPAEMTIGKMRALVKRLFKLSVSDVQLSLVFNDDLSQKTVLDNNLKQLSFYSISDKDKIAVEW